MKHSGVLIVHVELSQQDNHPGDYEPVPCVDPSHGDGNTSITNRYPVKLPLISHHLRLNADTFIRQNYAFGRES